MSADRDATPRDAAPTSSETEMPWNFGLQTLITNSEVEGFPLRAPPNLPVSWPNSELIGQNS